MPSEDHMVKLVSITPNAEQLVSYCARVSNPQNQDNPDKAKLLRYLIKHKHWSPFEMAHVVMEIETSRAIAAQILRHRSFSFQEFSQRYADTSLLPTTPLPNLRRQDLKNRQNSIDDLDPFTIQDFEIKAQMLFDQAKLLYGEMLKAGVAKECAREVLPLATRTRIYMAGSLRSWIHYVDLRSANGTQLEHKGIALQAKAILMEQVPTIAEAMWS